MVLMNIVAKAPTREFLRKYNRSYIRVCDSVDNIVGEMPTLIYGVKLADEIFGSLRTRDRKINQYFYWTYKEDEITSECWVDLFIKTTLDQFFDHNDIGIDVVFQEVTPEDILYKVKPNPLIHNGRYEVYLCQTTFEDQRSKLSVFSMKKDSLKYVGIDPEKMVEDMIVKLDGACLVFSPDEVDIVNIHPRPILLQQAYHAATGKILTIEEIFHTFESERCLSKQEILVYLVKLTRFLQDKFEFMLDK